MATNIDPHPKHDHQNTQIRERIYVETVHYTGHLRLVNGGQFTKVRR